ncbi:hypothetical protein OSTOST_08093, partial [Ostertagia ostertagi]
MLILRRVLTLATAIVFATKELRAASNAEFQCSYTRTKVGCVGIRHQERSKIARFPADSPVTAGPSFL